MEWWWIIDLVNILTCRALTPSLRCDWNGWILKNTWPNTLNPPNNSTIYLFNSEYRSQIQAFHYLSNRLGCESEGDRGQAAVSKDDMRSSIQVLHLARPLSHSLIHLHRWMNERERERERKSEREGSEEMKELGPLIEASLVDSKKGNHSKHVWNDDE